uniref:Uncharacterized protein n=1 Tax=Lactuca sativa TaxID=4236 RepID=A0A9R1US61_LACSA|nr:hypothetical protein LSAT_V11C800395570 [Lactuca sativa]
MKMHDDLEQKVNLILKGVVGIIIKDYFLRLTQSQRTLFEASPFGRFLGMHVSNGDPVLVHLMMLYEVRSQQVFGSGRFLFEIQRVQLDFGETEYILISGLRFGPYVDLLHDEKGRSNSNLRARLFPYFTDAYLRFKDLKEYIMSPNYLQIQDEDAVCMRYIILDLYFGVDALNVNPESTKIHKYTVPGFMLPFEPNNQHVVVMTTEMKIMEPFYISYVNWTLNHVESPP